MNVTPLRFVAALALCAAASAPAADLPAGGQHRNFAVAVYMPVGAVRHLADPAVFAAEWAQISSQVKVDKVYI